MTRRHLLHTAKRLLQGGTALGLACAAEGYFYERHRVVTETHRLWQTVRTKNRLGSGVIAGGHIYVLNTEGIAECMELKTGKSIWAERLKGSGKKSESWSSMVLVGENIYVQNQSGDTIVLKASPKFELVALNSLGDEMTNSSQAVSNGEIFIRTFKTLWCIGETKTSAAK